VQQHDGGAAGGGVLLRLHARHAQAPLSTGELAATPGMVAAL